jgi:hypothetical protein
MLQSKELTKILHAELLAGNEIAGEYKNQFANCKILVTLTKPLRISHAVPIRIEKFVNHDAHFPLGGGFKDAEYQEILIAPFV